MYGQHKQYTFATAFNEFIAELLAGLQGDERRWGDTLLKRNRSEQDKRISDRIAEYFENPGQFKDPAEMYRRIAGLAFVGWMRIRKPGYSKEWEK